MIGLSNTNFSQLTNLIKAKYNWGLIFIVLPIISIRCENIVLTKLNAEIWEHNDMAGQETQTYYKHI